MLFLLISLLLFGLVIASPLQEDLHQGEERQDVASTTYRPNTMRKSEESPTSDPFQGYQVFMRRSDEENFDNLLQHSAADFILRPLQMLDFSRNIVSFMARSEDEHENLGRRIIDRIIRFGDTMGNRIKDSLEQHDRYRRGARGQSSSPSYPYPYYQYSQPQYIVPPQNSYPYQHCYGLASRMPEPGPSSNRGRGFARNRKGQSNQVVICEISVNSQEEPTYFIDQPQDIYDIHHTNVDVSVPENGQYSNGQNGY